MTDYALLIAFGGICIVVLAAYLNQGKGWADWILNLLGKEKK